MHACPRAPELTSTHVSTIPLAAKLLAFFMYSQLHQQDLVPLREFFQRLEVELLFRHLLIPWVPDGPADALRQPRGRHDELVQHAEERVQPHAEARGHVAPRRLQRLHLGPDDGRFAALSRRLRLLLAARHLGVPACLAKDIALSRGLWHLANVRGPDRLCGLRRKVARAHVLRALDDGLPIHEAHGVDADEMADLAHSRQPVHAEHEVLQALLQAAPRPLLQKHGHLPDVPEADRDDRRERQVVVRAALVAFQRPTGRPVCQHWLQGFSRTPTSTSNCSSAA